MLLAATSSGSRSLLASSFASFRSGQSSSLLVSLWSSGVSGSVVPQKAALSSGAHPFLSVPHGSKSHPPAVSAFLKRHPDLITTPAPPSKSLIEDDERDWSDEGDLSSRLTMTSQGPDDDGFEACILRIDNTSKVTTLGRVLTFNAIAIVGDRKGLVGYGYGRGADTQTAVARAQAEAKKNIVFVNRCNSRTLFYPLERKHKCVKVNLWPRSTGRGLKCDNVTKQICRLAGIEDLTSKVHGSRNILTRIKIIFHLLERQEHPNEVASRRGMSVLRADHYGKALVRSADWRLHKGPGYRIKY